MPSPSSLPAGIIDLHDQVEKVHGLNISTQHSEKFILQRQPDQFLETDCDEQLMLHVVFRQAVKIHSIRICCDSLPHAPKTIKLFQNMTNLGFDEVESGLPTQEILLDHSTYEENESLILLRFVKFQNVNSLNIFVLDNLGGQETTRIYQLQIYGQLLECTKDVSQLKDMKHEH